MADLPKQQKEYFSRIKQALSSGDEDELANLVRQKDPLAIRHDLSTILGQHVQENYDNPRNIFSEKKLIEDIPVEYTDLPEGIAGKFNKTEGKILVPKVDLEKTPRQIGVESHELAHALDKAKGFEGSQKFNPSMLKKTGLEAAEEAFGGHHARGFFEKEALLDLLRNKKLGMLAPVLKAAGIGAIGAAAAGIGEKAMAGDLSGAASDTGELAYDVIAPPALQAASPTTLGNSELPPEEMEKRQKFNQLKQKLTQP